MHLIVPYKKTKVALTLFEQQKNRRPQSVSHDDVSCITDPYKRRRKKNLQTIWPRGQKKHCEDKLLPAENHHHRLLEKSSVRSPNIPFLICTTSLLFSPSQCSQSSGRHKKNLNVLLFSGTRKFAKRREVEAPISFLLLLPLVQTRLERRSRLP